MIESTINHYLQFVTMTEKESGARIYTSSDGRFEIHVSCADIAHQVKKSAELPCVVADGGKIEKGVYL